MFWIRPPAILGQVFSDAWWRLPVADKKVFITFDDGPHPETTPFILDQLDQYGMKATFFCLGRNVKAHPELFEQMTGSGHAVGLHSYDHLNGWKVSNDTYMDDLAKAEELVKSRFFRPPYGKLTWSLWKELKQRYQIVMWTTSPEDYKTELESERILERLTKNVCAGDIIVLHENDKSKAHIRKVFPEYLRWLHENEFTSDKLPTDLKSNDAG